MTKLPYVLACSAALLVATPAQAATVFDPAGDFLPSYSGPQLADLDILSFTVLYNSTTNIFTLGWTTAGAIDPATAGFYVIGVDTGLGANAPFGSIGAPNVIFDQALLIQKSGAATLAGANVGTASIVGNSASINLAATLFPSTGRAAGAYGFNIWPRSGAAGNGAVSDFAPNNGLLSAVPEPRSWGLLLLGFVGIGLAMRGRRRRQWVAPQLA